MVRYPEGAILFELLECTGEVPAGTVVEFTGFSRDEWPRDRGTGGLFFQPAYVGEGEVWDADDRGGWFAYPEYVRPLTPLAVRVLEDLL